MTYEVRHAEGGRISVGPQVTDQEPAAELEQMLLANGLYADEASAMVETWRGSWFEEGTRLLYLVPRGSIDERLPLEISPAPAAVARVFVGRMELVTPAIAAEVKDALRANRSDALRSHGRFLDAIGRRIVAESAPGDRARLDQRLQDVSSSWPAPRVVCGS